MDHYHGLCRYKAEVQDSIRKRRVAFDSHDSPGSTLAKYLDFAFRAAYPIAIFGVIAHKLSEVDADEYLQSAFAGNL